MTAGVKTVAAHFGRQIRVQKEIAGIGTMRLRMATLAGIVAPDLVPECAMVAGDMLDMAALAQMVARLFQKVIVVAAVRLVTFDTAVAVNRIGDGGIVFIGEWTAFILMACLASTVQIVRQPIILPLHEPMAIETGQGSLHNRMVGTAAEFGADGAVAAQAKFGFGVQQLPFDGPMDFMAFAAFHLLHGVDVETEIVQVGMGGMACRAERNRIMTCQVGRVADIFF